MRLRSPIDFLRACGGLLVTAVAIRFRFGGAYWRWRMMTAMGDGDRPASAAQRKAGLEYGLWVSRMRRL
ncbi:MAG: hypothetical protein AAGI17_10180 [Planctomycetota bacterium]